MRITRLFTDHLRVPRPRPDRVSLSGTRPAASDAIELILVYLETDTDLSGLGFTYLTGPGSDAVRSLIDTELAPLVLGEDPRETDRILAKVEARFRPVGF